MLMPLYFIRSRRTGDWKIILSGLTPRPGMTEVSSIRQNAF
jgi:hypothetical protein